jgi:hypothetical protein
MSSAEVISTCGTYRHIPWDQFQELLVSLTCLELYIGNHKPWNIYRNLETLSPNCQPENIEPQSITTNPLFQILNLIRQSLIHSPESWTPKPQPLCTLQSNWMSQRRLCEKGWRVQGRGFRIFAVKDFSVWKCDTLLKIDPNDRFIQVLIGRFTNHRYMRYSLGPVEKCWDFERFFGTRCAVKRGNRGRAWTLRRGNKNRRGSCARGGR